MRSSVEPQVLEQVLKDHGTLRTLSFRCITNPVWEISCPKEGDSRSSGNVIAIDHVRQAISDEGLYIAERMQSPSKVTPMVDERVLSSTEK